MNIVISGGGTAGHIYPALALAEVLCHRDHDVVFAGTPTGIEARLAKEAGLPFEPFEATGFNRNHPMTIISAVAKMIQSTSRAKRWFADSKPDVVVGFGGYVSLPVCRAARKCGIPFVIHEQNSVMGLANKRLAKHATAVALTYENAGKAVSSSAALTLTGNPVRASVLHASRKEGRALLGIPDKALMLLVFGGSLGARHINNALVGLKDTLLAVEGLYIVHISGPKEYSAVAESLSLTAEEARRWKLLGYQDRMGDTLAASDMVISRAGATSLAEISALHIPALLVPYPFATENHQETNAREFVECGAAVMVADDQVESAEFSEQLFTLIENDHLRASMREAAATFQTGDAATRLADVVIEAAKSARGGTILPSMEREGR